MLFASLPVGADDALFDEQDLFNLTISAPLTTLMREVGTDTRVGGALELEDGTSVAMRCSTYGISRLRECQLPSMLIELEDGGGSGTPFEGHQAVRLVTPCRMGGDHDRFTVLEYLAYRSYNLLTEISLKTRLVRVRFHDTEKPNRAMAGYGFFVEDINHAAVRNGLRWTGVSPASLADLDPSQLTLLTLFQFMIGNTDWSAVKGHGPSRCCHNVAMLQAPPETMGFGLPYDFDQAGLVSTPYSAPSPELGITHVSQRVYRGYCEMNEFVDEALDRMVDRRDAVRELFEDPGLPYPKSRKKGLAYLDGFYAVAGDPKKVDRLILSKCR
jgi:hypothetical protein